MSFPEPKQPSKVLTVNAEPAVRRALARQLGALGHQTVEAADGSAGLSMLRLVKPDIVMLDLRMPKLDGHGFLKAMAVEKSDAAVIVLSGNADVGDRVGVILS